MSGKQGGKHQNLVSIAGVIAVFLGFTLFVASFEGRSVSSGMARSSAQGAVFLLRNDNLHIIDHVQGYTIRSYPLSGKASGIVPTPGGVSVFVHYRDQSYVDIFSSQTFEYQGRNDIPLSSVDQMSFSPDGSRVYLIGEDSLGNELLAEASHSLLTFGEFRTVGAPGGQGPLVPGNRGAFLHRASSNGIIALSRLNLLPQAAQEESGSGDIGNLRNLIYAEQNDLFFAVRSTDEGTHRGLLINAQGGGTVLTFEDALRENAVPVVNEDLIWTLSSDGGAAIAYASKTNGSASSPANLPLGFSADFILSAGPGVLWAVSERGFVAVIENQRVSRSFQLYQVDGSEIDQIEITASAFRREGASFACF